MTWISSFRRREVLLLTAVFVLGLALRFYGLNWDSTLGLHSDERNVLTSVNNVRIFQDGGFAPKLDPEFYAYGHFPVYLNKGLVELARSTHQRPIVGYLVLVVLTVLLGWIFLLPLEGERLPAALRPRWIQDIRGSPALILGGIGTIWLLWFVSLHPLTADHPVLVLRSLSAWSGTLTLLVVYRLGCQLLHPNAGLIGAAFLAVTPLHIQQCHYGTVDIFLSFITTLCVLLAVRLVERPTIRGYAVAGVLVGMALGTKTSGVVIVAPFIVGAGMTLIGAPVQAWRRAAAQMTVLGLTSLVVLFLTSPFTFLGWEEFQKRMDYEGKVVFGVYMPTYTVQFFGTRPFEVWIDNLVHYGLGTPLGLLVVFASLYMVVHAAVSRSAKEFAIFAYVLPYLASIALWQAQFIRYQVPVLPFYLLFAGYVLARGMLGATAVRGATLVITSILLVATGSYGISYAALLGRTHTRVAASEWLYENAPEGASILHEGPWDEALPLELPGQPLGRFRRLSSLDDYTKLSHVLTDRITKNNVEDDRTVPFLANQILQSDYIVLSSKRIVGGLLNVPKHYVVSANLYRTLFSGALGYDLVKTFSDYPSMLGMEWNDDLAEESWQTNDHPKVFIFKRVRQLPRAAIAGMLRGLPNELAAFTGEQIPHPAEEMRRRQRGEIPTPDRRGILSREGILTMTEESFERIPVNYGRYQDEEAAAVQLQGKPITASPLNEPRDIDVDAYGNIYIADFRNYRAVVLAPDFRIRTVVGGTKGSEPRMFNDPCGIASDSEGNIIVADTWNGRVQKFTRTGKFLWQVRDLFAPRAVATDTAGNIYVVESGNCAIHALSPNGTKITTWGSRGEGPGQFQEPIGIAVSDAGEVFVCDTWNRRVQVFSTTGKFLREFAVDAWAGEHWREPYIDIHGDTLVLSDPPQNRVLLYGSDGQSRGELDIPLPPGPALTFPMGVAIGPNGTVFVADTLNHRILKAPLPAE